MHAGGSLRATATDGVRRVVVHVADHWRRAPHVRPPPHCGAEARSPAKESAGVRLSVMLVRWWCAPGAHDGCAQGVYDGVLKVRTD